MIIQLSQSKKVQRGLKSGMGKRYIKNRLKRFLSPTGFTLLELLVVLIIIGFLVTAIGRTFRKVDKDVQYVAALSDMKAISDAIVKGIYPDLGCIPCTGEDPVSAITSLCLDLKRCMEEIQEYTYQNTYWGEIYQCIEYQDLTPECRELLFLLAGQPSNDRKCGKNGILKSKFTENIWNKYYSKGWRGPYIECNATYYYNPEASEEGYYLPAIATSWADKCEKMARKAEKNGDDDLAKEYRKGKYYQILKPLQTRCIEWGWIDHDWACIEYGWEIPKDTACIVCRGPDCLPGDNGNNDVQDYLSCEFSCQEKEECKGPYEKCLEGCPEECQNSYPGLPSWHWKIKKCIENCEGDCEKVYKECVTDCISECEKGFKNLAITNPNNDDYMDIGDDIVMSVFSGIVRSPLEK